MRSTTPGTIGKVELSPGQQVESSALRFLYRLRWPGLFVLGIVAFWPVLSVWFLADDFGHLRWHQHSSAWDAFALTDNLFYRPLGMALTWNLGPALFGLNAQAYHAVSLLLHTLVAFLAAKAFAAVSGEERLGWIAGALYAVYPLSTEPVAWLAAQWDLWAAMCALAAVWGFAVAWGSRDWRHYAAALFATLCGVFMKEVVLVLPMLMPFVALATHLSPPVAGKIVAPNSRGAWLQLLRRIGLWSLPFAAPTLLFMGIRIAATGSLGGYGSTTTDYLGMAWNAFVSAARFMVMPFNRQVFDSEIVPVAGWMVGIGFLTGLVLLGRRRWPLHLLAFTWWIVFLVPALNVVNLGGGSTAGDRVLHFSLIGFLLSVSALLAAAMERQAYRRAAWAVVALVLAVCVPLTWLQLQPWIQASRQAESLVQQMSTMFMRIPFPPAQLNVKNLPLEHKGAYVFLNGLGDALVIYGRRQIAANRVAELDHSLLGAPFSPNRNGVYNVELAYDATQGLYHVQAAQGATAGGMPVPAEDAYTWDFTQCPKIALDWQPRNAAFECTHDPGATPGRQEFATFTPASGEAYIALSGLEMDLSSSKFVRVGVHARLSRQAEGRTARLFWSSGQGDTWLEENSFSFALQPVSDWRIYWLYVPASELQSGDTRWRLDLADGGAAVDIAWIAITPVP